MFKFFLKLESTMSVPRTPTKSAPAQDNFRDLSESIIVSKTTKKSEKSKEGVYTGTRAKISSSKLPTPPPPPIIPRNNLNTTKSPIALNNPNSILNPNSVHILNTEVIPNSLPIGSNVQNAQLDIAEQSTSRNAASNIALNVEFDDNFVNRNESSNQNDVIVPTNDISFDTHPNHNVPKLNSSSDYIQLVDELVSTVREYRLDEINSEIERRVKESVQSCFADLIKEYDLVPKSTSQSSGSNTQSNPRSNSISEFVREFRTRFTVGNREILETEHRNNRSNNYPSVSTENPIPEPAPNGQQNSQPSYNGSRSPYDQNRQYFDRKPIRLDQWDIKFDGKRDGTITVEEFVFRVEYLQSHYGCPWEIVMRDFHILLRDQAKEWYWLYIRNNRQADWNALRHAIIFQFQSTTSDFEVMRDIVERRQQINESVDTFFHAVLKLRAKLAKPVPEYDMIRILKRNLRDNIARIVYPMNIYSVDQLRHECYQVEQNFSKRDRNPISNTNRFPPMRSVHVNEVEFEESVDEIIDDGIGVEEARLIGQNRANMLSKLICYNCRKPGHVYMQCPEDPKIFCYRCGLPNFKTINCPECLKGNLEKNVTQQGESRSQNPPLVQNPFKKAEFK